MKNQEKNYALPGRFESFWIDSTPETNFSPLGKNISVDVAVIGGGIAGLTSAFLLKNEGRTIAIIEADRIIKDVTGHTTAKITSLHGYIYKHLIDTFGQEKARLYAEGNQKAIKQIASFVKDLNIDCDFERASAYTYTENDQQLKQIENEIEAAQKLGLPASFTKETDLPFKIKGAVYFEDQAQFHPRKYLLGLSKIIEGDKNFIFENTRALAIKEDDKILTIVTNRGEIKAKHAIIATHFPFYDKGRFYTKLYPRRSYVLGVKIKSEPPKGMYYSRDKDIRSIRYIKTEKGPMLSIGGEGHKAGQVTDTISLYKNLENYAHERFNVESIDYHWSTQDNDTPDGVPYIGRSPGSKNIYLATGFGGWGMTNGTLAATILKDLILDYPNEWAPFFDPSRPLKQVKRFFTEGINIAGQYANKYISKPPKPSDLSLSCTHLGCRANWNNAEKTWDCPCHGSRFSKDGKVIHGPALRDLSKKDIK